MITMVVGFLMSPFVVHHLGNTGYGIWTLILSFCGYFGMLAKLGPIKAGATYKVWIDPQGYQAAVAEREQAFEAELKRQEQ